MSKILIITGLVLMTVGFARVANAGDVLVTQKDIKIEAGLGNTYIALSKDGNTECILKHDTQSADRAISISTGLNVVSITQTDFKPTLKANGQEFIEMLGGKYDAKKIKTDLDIEKEIVALGGSLSHINGKIVTDYKSVTNISLTSSVSEKDLVLSCRSIKKESINDIMTILSTEGSFELLQIVEDSSTALSETSAEDLL